MSVVPLHSGGLVPAVVLHPNEELINKIKGWLIDAESGQLRSMGYVCIDRDRAICTGWTGMADHHDMTAGVNILAFRYMLVGQQENA